MTDTTTNAAAQPAQGLPNVGGNDGLVRMTAGVPAQPVTGTPNTADQPTQVLPNPTGNPGLVRMNSNKPAQKVTGATVAAAIVQLLIWLNNSRGGPQITPDVSAALTVIVTFAVGYLTPPGSTEEVVRYIDPRSPAG